HPRAANHDTNIIVRPRTIHRRPILPPLHYLYYTDARIPDLPSYPTRRSSDLTVDNLNVPEHHILSALLPYWRTPIRIGRRRFGPVIVAPRHHLDNAVLRVHSRPAMSVEINIIPARWQLPHRRGDGSTAPRIPI